MKEQFEIKKSYSHDDILRKSFNDLAGVTYGLNFENWYQNGYWTEKYNPYSIVIENKVVANVSVNIMDFVSKEENKRYIQLGTVMTDSEYRNQGLIKIIMQEIENDFQGSTDGFYLFGNDSVLEFYPKFGYRKGIEYQYSKIVSNNLNGTGRTKYKHARRIQMDKKEDWAILEGAIEKSVNNSAFEMKNNKELIMFYITQFMQKNVYYVEDEGAYVIAEIDGDKLFLHSVFSEKIVCIDTIIEAFGDKINKVILEFTPLTSEGYQVVELCKMDSTLFLKGIGFDCFEQNKRMFSTLSHA